MSAIDSGGFPLVARYAVNSTGAYYGIAGKSRYLQISADAALKVFFTIQDFNAGTNWVDVNATTPFAGPACVQGVWLKGAANAVVTAFLRN